MPIDPRRGYSNILTTRLHRHNQVATLFRSVEPGLPLKAANRAGFTSLPGLSPAPVMRASLAAPESDLQWGDVVDNESFGEADAFHVSAAVQAAEAPPQARPETPSPLKSQPASQKPSFQEDNRNIDHWQPVSEESDQLTNYPAWQRLDDIYQSQQAQVQQEQAAAAGLGLPVQGQPEIPAPQTAPVTPRSEKSGAISPARSSPNVVQKQPVRQAVPPASFAPTGPVNPPAQPATRPADSHSDTGITDDVWRRLQAIYRAHEEKNKEERETAVQQAEKAPEPPKQVQKLPAVRPAPSIPPAPKIVELQPASSQPAQKLPAAPMAVQDQAASRSTQEQPAAPQAAQPASAAPSSLTGQADSQPAVQESPSDSRTAQPASAAPSSLTSQADSQSAVQESPSDSWAAQQISAPPPSIEDQPASTTVQERSSISQPAEPEIGNVHGSSDLPLEIAGGPLPPIQIAEELPIQAQPVVPDLTGSPTPMKPAPSRAERAWQRLQNIFGRRAEIEPAEPVDSTQQAVASAPSPAAVELPEAQPFQLSSLPEMLPIQETMPASLESAAGVQAEPAEPPEPAALAAAQLAEGHPDVPAATTVSQETPAAIQPVRTGSQTIAGDSSSAATQITTRPSPVPAPPRPSTPAGLISSEDDFEAEAAEIFPDEVQQQPMPLEAIWPVERREFPAPEHVHRTEAPLPGVAGSSIELTAENVAEIHRALDTVQPGQATDSKVELITPPRPRPIAVPTQSSFDQSKTPAEELIAAAELPSVQRSVDSEASKTQAATMREVPSNLTPELAKLWGMLDGMETRQAEPAASSQADISREPQTSLTASQALAAAIQRAEAPSQPELHPSVLSSFEQPETSTIAEPLTVQRQAESPAAIAPTAAAPAAAETGGAAGQAGKPDIDALARQVYSEVRRKLALEWERMRR
jgi:hypothetical protein